MNNKKTVIVCTDMAAISLIVNIFELIYTLILYVWQLYTGF